MTKRFEQGRAVVIQVAFDRGRVGDVDLVSETFDMQESKYSACTKS